jgi:hypothetical protein
MTKRVDKNALFAPAPATPPRAGDLRAIQALGSSKTERVYFNGHPRYARGLQELKNMSAESVALKDFIVEAFDDLFEKYESGEGRFKATDVEELRRRIKNLPQ